LPGQKLERAVSVRRADHVEIVSQQGRRRLSNRFLVVDEQEARTR